MKIKKLPIQGCYEIITESKKDKRGNFIRVYDNLLLKKIVKNKWQQVNESFNKKKGTFRGFHCQIEPYAESKLIRVINGKVLDMVIDLRKNSPTFKHFIKITLMEENNMIFIPRGCAHGYITLKKNTRLMYFHDNVYSKKHELNISFRDPIIKPKLKLKKKNMSEKDWESLCIDKQENLFIF